MIPVVFLHGFLGAPSTFDRVYGCLAPGRRGRGEWLPGHGQPSRTDLPERFEAVVDALADCIEEPSIVVGYSMGARLGLALALEHPDRVAAAVLIGVNPGLSGPERAARAAWDDARADEVLALGMDAFVDRWEAQPLFETQRALPAALRAEERARRTAHEPQEIASAMRSLGLSRQPDYRGRLGELRVPVTLLSGALDAKFTALHAAVRVPGTRARVVEGVGHNVALEAPEAVAAAIEEYAVVSPYEKGRIHP